MPAASPPVSRAAINPISQTNPGLRPWIHPQTRTNAKPSTRDPRLNRAGPPSARPVEVSAGKHYKHPLPCSESRSPSPASSPKRKDWRFPKNNQSDSRRSSNQMGPMRFEGPGWFEGQGQSGSRYHMPIQGVYPYFEYAPGHQGPPRFAPQDSMQPPMGPMAQTIYDNPIAPQQNSQVDLKDLFSKLVSTSIIKPLQPDAAPPASTEFTGALVAAPQVEEEKEDLPDLTSFIIDDMKQRYESIVTKLYSGKQCSLCSMRFTATQTEMYTEHLDWHFRQNHARKVASKKGTHRGWYCSVKDWIQFEEITDLEERAKSQFFEKDKEEEVQKRQAAAKEKEFQSVRAKKNQVNETSSYLTTTQQNFPMGPGHVPKPMNPQFRTGPMIFPAQQTGNFNVQLGPAFSQPAPGPFYNSAAPAVGMQRLVNLLGTMNQHFLPQNSVPFGQTSQVVPAENHFSQVDVNDLFSKLLSTGIIKPLQPDVAPPAGTDLTVAAVDAPQVGEEQEMEKKNLPDLTSFIINDMKQRYESIVTKLYSGKQCSICSMRFTATQTEMYTDHLDWHFRQNHARKVASKKGTHRGWYCSVKDWIQFEEISDLEERKFFEKDKEEEVQKRQAAAKGKEFQSVRAKKNQVNELCEVCQESFETYWVDEEEDCFLKNAVQFDDKNFHPLCLEDYKND